MGQGGLLQRSSQTRVFDGLELFFEESGSAFLTLLDRAARAKAYRVLRSACKALQLHHVEFGPSSLSADKWLERSGVVEKWKSRNITNFEFLMELNKYAGRTYDDLAQYPIFPWELKG